MNTRSIAALVAALATFAVTPLTAQTLTKGQIRVLGRARVAAIPDQVVTRVGVSNRAATPKEALDQNSAIARKIIAFAKKFGVAVEDIQTDSVRLSPIYRRVRDGNGVARDVLEGYSASNQVRVRLKEISRLGAFMREVLDQGATNIGGISFGLSDPSKTTDAALAKAVADAFHKAQQLAQAAHVKLGSLREISYPPLVQARSGYARPAAAAAAGGSAPVPIEAGTVDITAAVEMIWTIE